MLRTIEAATEAGFRMEDESTFYILGSLRYVDGGLYNTFPDRLRHEPLWTYLVTHHLQNSLRRRVWLGMLTHPSVSERQRVWNVPTEYYNSWMNSRWLRGAENEGHPRLYPEFFELLSIDVLREMVDAEFDVLYRPWIPTDFYKRDVRFYNWLEKSLLNNNIKSECIELAVNLHTATEDDSYVASKLMCPWQRQLEMDRFLICLPLMRNHTNIQSGFTCRHVIKYSLQDVCSDWNIYCRPTFEHKLVILLSRRKQLMECLLIQKFPTVLCTLVTEYVNSITPIGSKFHS